MKVKEIESTANVAWSPAAQHPIYLAAGTAAQQLDATFSTSAALDIYGLDLAEPGLEMSHVGSVQSECRFHKLVWGSHGMKGDYPSGSLIAGGDNGRIFIYDPHKMIAGGESLLHTLDKHVGAVGSLDINPFQSNLLASGASESDIYIWDLNNPVNPMTPGSKSQPPDDVNCIAWNRQVQHILASTYAGRCIVWDLRKNEPIIKVSDSMSRIKCKLISWHPDVATQMCLASEDDHSPVIQLWDLRFATSPLKTLESHQRGILSMAWCPHDPDLLLSCGKDNRILCWNPNSSAQNGEVVYELPNANQWSFDVQWCPRNPAIISSCSFDGHVSIFSLMGGAPPPKTPSKVADAFPEDPFSQSHHPATPSETAPAMLKRPPKWLCRPIRASFGFGGKLISFENTKPSNPQAPVQRTLHISQVVTETDLVARSNQLENALSNGQFAEFCAMKIANSQSESEENIWNFLKVNFENEPRTRFLELLGYNQMEISRKVHELTGSSGDVRNGLDADQLADKIASLDSSDQRFSRQPLAKKHRRFKHAHGSTDGLVDSGDAFEQIAAHEKEVERDDEPLPIEVDDDCDGLVAQALLTANFEAAVEVCLHNDRMAEAIILALAGGPELLAQTQKKFFRKNHGNLNRLISSVVTRDYEHIIRTCELDNWKEALAVILTYAEGEDFASLCTVLGDRLQSAGGSHTPSACLCYICAGSIERLVECWAKTTPNPNSPDVLSDLVEKVMILRKSVEMVRGGEEEVGVPLAQKLSQYAELLAAQGCLNTAMNYLGTSNEMSLAILRDRLYQALGQAASHLPAPPCPFQVQTVHADAPHPAAKAPAAQLSAQQPNAKPGAPSAFHPGQVGGTFQTVTTPSSYYQPASQPNYSAPEPLPSNTYNQPGLYTPQSTSVPTPGSYSKGPLSQKYPSASYPQSPLPQDPYASQSYTQSYGPVGNYPQTTQPMTSQPQIYNPLQQQQQPQPPQMAPEKNYGYEDYDDDDVNDEDDDETLAASTSSVEKFRQLWNKPDVASAADFIRGITVGASGRRRSDSDDEIPQGVRRPSMTYMQQRRSSQIFTEVETTKCSGTAPGAPSVNPPMHKVPSFQEIKPATGWNDTPIVQERPKKSTQSYVPPAPITQPIYGVPQPTMGSQPPPMGQQQQQQQQPPQQPMDQGPPGAPSYGSTPAPSIYNPQDFQQQQQSQQFSPKMAPEPPKPVEKGPIPSEHQVLKDILDKLASQCMAKAANAQTKRKLEDVFRKLESLYDKLRDNALSAAVVSGLHQIVGAIQKYDYHAGLAVHTQMISQGNFSEISSFMPGIKVLIQTASTLQVYVQ